MSGFLLDLAENVAAGVATTGAIALLAWFWKIRPHVLAQKAERTEQAQHRADARAEFDALHDRIDEIAGKPATETGKHGNTEAFAAVSR